MRPFWVAWSTTFRRFAMASAICRIIAWSSSRCCSRAARRASGVASVVGTTVGPATRLWASIGDGRRGTPLARFVPEEEARRNPMLRRDFVPPPVEPDRPRAWRTRLPGFGGVNPSESSLRLTSGGESIAWVVAPGAVLLLSRSGPRGEPALATTMVR